MQLDHGLDGLCSNSEGEGFTFLQIVQTRAGAQSAFSAMNTAVFPGG
jgi:hypothetical protein